VRGAEAESFLQGQLSQDVHDVGADGVWSLLLSPNSDVLTSCLVTSDELGFIVTVPLSVAEVAFARLKRFHLRTACTLQLENDVQGPFDTVGEQVRGAHPGPDEFAAQLSPQSFGATFVAATVSFTKGCFTGQELVGRLDARGSSVPWRFVRCHGPSIEAINDVLAAKGPEGPRGVTTAVRDDDGVVALGFIHRRSLSEEGSLRIGDVKVETIG
jgi:folate-binding protein YgfZ